MIHLTITGPYMACPIWATDSLDNEYSTFSVLMGEREIFHLNIPVTDSASREPDGFTYLKLSGDLFVNEEPASKSVKSQKTLLVMLSPQEGEAIDSDRIMAYLNHIHFVDSPKWEEQPEDELHYHAPYGFLNDPNGFTYQNGQWILYHQHNPMDRQWQNMSWGSSYSTDGLHYHFRGDVLLPDRSGSSFSGCSLLNERGLLGLPKDAILFFYTMQAETLSSMKERSIREMFTSHRDSLILWMEEKLFCPTLLSNSQNIQEKIEILRYCGMKRARVISWYCSWKQMLLPFFAVQIFCTGRKHRNSLILLCGSVLISSA